LGRIFRDSKDAGRRFENLQVLAESSQRISATLKTRHSDVEWENISGFRHVLVYEYLGINLACVWEVVERGVPELRPRVAATLRELSEGPQER